MGPRGRQRLFNSASGKSRRLKQGCVEREWAIRSQQYNSPSCSKALGPSAVARGRRGARSHCAFSKKQMLLAGLGARSKTNSPGAIRLGIMLRTRAVRTFGLLTGRGLEGTRPTSPIVACLLHLAKAPKTSLQRTRTPEQMGGHLLIQSRHQGGASANTSVESAGPFHGHSTLTC